ncbi:MAG: cytidine deaminase [Bacteroidales bacterium]|nr:cytidine deaminase [Bacteroidales bacterium]
MEHFKVSLDFEVYQTVDELNADDRELLNYAAQAAENAYAPYSLFKVGAAVRLKSGKIVTGNNQENVAYPSGLCAERVALFYASANYPGEGVDAIAVTAKAINFSIDEPVTPCGSCRQVMIEAENQNEHKIRVIMQGGQGKIWISKSVENLLPIAFKADELKK